MTVPKTGAPSSSLCSGAFTDIITTLAVFFLFFFTFNSLRKRMAEPSNETPTAFIKLFLSYFTFLLLVPFYAPSKFGSIN